MDSAGLRVVEGGARTWIPPVVWTERRAISSVLGAHVAVGVVAFFIVAAVEGYPAPLVSGH